jgi:hypothetical protein
MYVYFFWRCPKQRLSPAFNKRLFQVKLNLGLIFIVRLSFYLFLFVLTNICYGNEYKYIYTIPQFSKRPINDFNEYCIFNKGSSINDVKQFLIIFDAPLPLVILYNYESLATSFPLRPWRHLWTALKAQSVNFINLYSWGYASTPRYQAVYGF